MTRSLVFLLRPGTTLELPEAGTSPALVALQLELDRHRLAHHLDCVIDLNQADFSIATEVYLDGSLLAVQRREPIGAPPDGASAFGNLTLSTSGPAVGTLAFDNILVQAGRHVVPEPSVALLFGAAALLAPLVRRNRR
jgi:hypothetical protein